MGVPAKNRLAHVSTLFQRAAYVLGFNSRGQASQDDERPAVGERPAGPGWVAPSLHLGNHKILTILLPLQQHALPQAREVLDHTFAFGSSEKFFSQRRHSYRGAA